MFGAKLQKKKQKNKGRSKFFTLHASLFSFFSTFAAGF